MPCRRDPRALLALKEALGFQKIPYLRWGPDSDSRGWVVREEGKHGVKI